MRQPRHLSHGLKHLEPCGDHSLSQCVIPLGLSEARIAAVRRAGNRARCGLCGYSERTSGSPAGGASWDGGQRPRSLSNGCGHWPGPSRPASSARRGGQVGTAPRKRSSQGSGWAGWTAAPLAQAVSGPHQRRCGPECDIPRERMARSCEALSLDTPGGLQCFAFTPERCSKRRLCRRHC
jgi:hypothetical protein